MTVKLREITKSHHLTLLVSAGEESERGSSSENICLNRMRRAAMAESRDEVSLLVASDLPTSFHLLVCDSVELNKFQRLISFTKCYVVFHSKSLEIDCGQCGSKSFPNLEFCLGDEERKDFPG